MVRGWLVGPHRVQGRSWLAHPEILQRTTPKPVEGVPPMRLEVPQGRYN